jgi:hypothetical protein
MAATVFVLCALTSLGSTVLLGRAWLASRSSLLFWSALGFAAFALNNLMLVVDEVVVPDADLGWTRDVSGLAAVAIILFGLVWRGDNP